MGPFGIFVSSIEMPDSPVLHAVVFRVGDLRCGAPAGIVREILPRMAATRIPGVAAAIAGLVNVRGALLTVLDAHELLHQTRRPGDEGAILVLQAAGRLIGLEVGEVRDFLTLPDAAVAPREQLPGVDPSVVRAVARHEGDHFIILELDALCAPLLPTERAASG
ncbi:MAG TPA: chemotaxis protein CheW [Gemmatimonadales bacterium]|nr:chemotaxis protein CheW [Gemmatimonadales bacterium]